MHFTIYLLSWNLIFLCNLLYFSCFLQCSSSLEDSEATNFVVLWTNKQPRMMAFLMSKIVLHSPIFYIIKNKIIENYLLGKQRDNLQTKEAYYFQKFALNSVFN